jgi:rfaE bifunctional protein kinase chain/domain
MDSLAPPIEGYLARFCQRHVEDEILPLLRRVRRLKVLLIGETIIDEYQFCTVLGKASKDPILAARWCSSESHVGGILAIARHLAGFCEQVDMLSLLGEVDSHEAFIRENLPAGVRPHFLYQESAPTIVKRRFVEEYLCRKLFEVYVIADKPINERLEDAICRKLQRMLPQYDLVIVADYGHGLFTERSIELVSEQARFLALNVQTNAANRGFNFITKYPRADYVSVDEQEIRLEARDPCVDIATLIKKTALRMACPHFLVTRGKYGVAAYWANEGFFEAPALAGQVVDTIGAGDAVLAVTAPCVALGAPAEVVALLANCAGAEACLSVGNREAIDSGRLVERLLQLFRTYPRIAGSDESRLPQERRMAS